MAILAIAVFDTDVTKTCSLFFGDALQKGTKVLRGILQSVEDRPCFSAKEAILAT